MQFVDNYLTCYADNEETASLVKLQTHKHSRTCRKKGKPICRFVSCSRSYNDWKSENHFRFENSLHSF